MKFTEAELYLLLNQSKPLWLNSADFSGANLSGGDLSVASLIGANMSGADLRDTNLRRANMSGADLRIADLQKLARFEDTNYSKATKWPDGFDPKAAGAVLKE